MFTVRNVGKTPQTRTQGTKIASDGLKGRIFECSLADLNQDEDQAFRKMFLKCEDVQGKNVLTNFYGMDFTTDKIRSLVRKWFSLIECRRRKTGWVHDVRFASVSPSVVWTKRREHVMLNQRKSQDSREDG